MLGTAEENVERSVQVQEPGLATASHEIAGADAVAREADALHQRRANVTTEQVLGRL